MDARRTTDVVLFITGSVLLLEHTTTTRTHDTSMIVTNVDASVVMYEVIPFRSVSNVWCPGVLLTLTWWWLSVNC